jgi:hypothetical protein
MPNTSNDKQRFPDGFYFLPRRLDEAARAQQPERMRHVGVLVGLASSADDPVAVGQIHIGSTANV